MATADIKPTKCALRYNPPTLILFYNDSTTGKHRRRSMPLRKFTKKTNISEYTTSLFDHPRHKTFLANIKRQQLESLLQKVQNVQGGNETESPSETLGTTMDESMTQLRQLPQLTKANLLNRPSTEHDNASLLAIDDELDRILSGAPEVKEKEKKNGNTIGIRTSHKSNTSKDKGTTSTISTVHAVGSNTTSTDPLNGFFSTDQPFSQSLLTAKPTGRQSLPPLQLSPIVTNSKPTFPSALSPNGDVVSHQAKQEKEADLLQVDNDEYSLSKEPLSELEEELTDSSGSDDSPEPLMNSDQLRALDDAKMVSSDESDKSDDGEDYNKMSPTEYEKQKAKMDEEFDQKRIKTSDPDYVYDKVIEHGKPAMESGWDDSSSTVSEF